MLSILGLLDSPSDGVYKRNEQPVQSLKMSEEVAHSKSRERIHLQAFN